VMLFRMSNDAAVLAAAFLSFGTGMQPGRSRFSLGRSVCTAGRPASSMALPRPEAVYGSGPIQEAGGP